MKVEPSREAGFYWVNRPHVGWIVAEWRPDYDDWGCTDECGIDNSYWIEIDERRLVREIGE